jgi:flagellar operon protein
VINTIDRIGTDLTAISSVTGSNSLISPSQESPPPGGSFRDLLTAAAGERSLQFSEHAMKRVEQRQIPLDGEQLDRLGKAMDTLSQRGSRQSLVMLDQYAYVVHPPSHTVVTAVEPDQSRDRIFTQIDSVVIG